MIISFGLPAVVRTAGKPEIMLLPVTNETMNGKKLICQQIQKRRKFQFILFHNKNRLFRFGGHQDCNTGKNLWKS